ncbi:diguanylate cyclase domain-containing protein [Hungatella hathewayi]
MAEALSGKISEAISSPYNPGDGAAEESVGISIGIAFLPVDGIDYEQLMKMADERMYTNKQSNKNS